VTAPEDLGLSLGEFEEIEPLVTHIVITAHEPIDGLVRIEWRGLDETVLDAMDNIGARYAAEAVSSITGWPSEQVPNGDGYPLLRFTRPPRAADIAA
jgi:hypothetical protein